MSSDLIPTPTKGILIIRPASRAIADTIMTAEVIAISLDTEISRQFLPGSGVIYQGSSARKLQDDLFYIEEDQIVAKYSIVQFTEMKKSKEKAHEVVALHR